VLDRPALQRLWDAVAERLQRNGLQPAGSVVLTSLDREERHAIAGLLGRPVPGERVTIELALLDQRLRAGSTGGLVALAAARRGPLVDRPGERRARQDARHAVWQAGRAALDTSRFATASWVERWLDDVRRGGALGRLAPERATATLVAAVTCIAQLPVGTGDPPSARGDLASRVAGDAHALDDGTVLASLVLRAVAAMTGHAYPSTAAGRRALWRAAGVITDEVSTTVLTLGLRSRDGTSWLDARTAARWETHLSGRDLRRVDLRPPDDGEVFVCENPRVLEAAVDRGSTCAVVCTQGQPAVVVLALVRTLAELGATLRYHGDFDWPGLTIANAMVGRHGCRPWRMSVDDYEAALARLAPMVGGLPLLDGPPVAAVWDPALTEAMARARQTIHEELVIEDLLADMDRGCPGAPPRSPGGCSTAPDARG
jgi:uncharacterized protein (TIGR02679 family)